MTVSEFIDVTYLYGDFCIYGKTNGNEVDTLVDGNLFYEEDIRGNIQGIPSDILRANIEGIDITDDGGVYVILYTDYKIR